MKTISIAALALIAACASSALAQDHDAHMQAHETTADDQSKAGALIKLVRESTERFKDVAVAEREGYALQFGCVSGSDSGAMGLHYVNGMLVNNGILDATLPRS